MRGLFGRHHHCNLEWPKFTNESLVTGEMVPVPAPASVQEELLAHLLAEHWVKIVTGEDAFAVLEMRCVLTYPPGLGLAIALRLPQLFLREDGEKPGASGACLLCCSAALLCAFFGGKMSSSKGWSSICSSRRLQVLP